MDSKSAMSLQEELQDAAKTSTSDVDTSASSIKSSEYAVKCTCVNVQSKSSSSSESSSTESSPQQCCLKQRLSSVLNNEYLSDVLFIVGTKKQRIPAHKLLLCVGSNVFRTMFSKNWSSESAEIEIPDIEPSAFLALLSFLYMDKIEITTDTVLEILYAAVKYAVQPLEDRCVDFLIESLCPGNAFMVLNEATLLDIPKLVKSSLEVIDENTIEAVTTDAFCDISIDTLCLVLSRNTLTIKEVKLFDAILSWSAVECLRNNLAVDKENQLSVLKKALPLIRFPLMSIEEFSTKVVPSGLFSNDELVPMFLYFSTKPKPPVPFNDAPRLSDRVLVVNRFRIAEPGRQCTFLGNKYDEIHFTCDQSLELLGYGLHCSLSGAAKYEVKLQLREQGSSNYLRNETAEFFCEGTSMTYRALFENPIKLTAFQAYAASLFTKGPDCFKGNEGLKKVTMDLLHGEKVTVTFSSNICTTNPNPLTTVSTGLIPELIFKV